jgi:hypothetical protein
VAPDLPVIAAAHDGVEAAKCFALGAAAVSVDPVADLAALTHQLRVAVWAAGEASPHALSAGHLRV